MGGRVGAARGCPWREFWQNIWSVSNPPDLVALAKLHGRFDPEAYAFVSEGLRHAAKQRGDELTEGSGRHLSAEELVSGVLDLAAQRYGLLAVQVLRQWGLRRSEDIGEITFHLIECGIFGKQPSDSQADFDNGPAFGRVIRERVTERLAAD